MFALLVSWLIMLFVFSVFGDGLLLLHSKITCKEEHYSFLDTFLLGMSFITLIISITSLFAPSDFCLLFALFVCSLVYWLCRNKHFRTLYSTYCQHIKSLPHTYRILIMLCLVFVLLHSLLAPIWVDTSYYHIQNIMWNDQYRVVPGLANLQIRFGFNSNYFLLCPVFGVKPLFGQYIFGIQSLCITLIFSCLIYDISKGRNLVAGIVSLFIFCFFIYVYKQHITSPSSDLIPNLLILYLILKILFEKDALKKYPLLYLAIPTLCLTLKLSSFMVGLFTVCVLWLFFKEKSYRQLYFSIVYAALIVIIWCVRTTIISGYLIFPYPVINLFSFDWKVPLQYVVDQKDYIQAFARVDNIPMREALNMNIAEWLPMWWKVGMFYHFPIANRLLFILCLISVPLMLVLLFISKNNRKKNSVVYGAWLVSLFGFVFWLFNAPDFRFAYGFIFPAAFIPFYIILFLLMDKMLFSETKAKALCLAVSLIAVLFVGVQSLRYVYYQRDTKEPFTSLIYKPEYLSRTKELRQSRYGSELEFIPYQINNVHLFIPTLETHCYDCPLPCSLDYTGGLQMRGKSLQDGFSSKTGAPYRKTY